jgi:hypothetical protein
MTDGPDMPAALRAVHPPTRRTRGYRCLGDVQVASDAELLSLRSVGMRSPRRSRRLRSDDLDRAPVGQIAGAGLDGLTPGGRPSRTNRHSDGMTCSYRPR